MKNTVKSKESYARWVLDNVYIYVQPSTGEIATEHEPELLAYMLVAMGQPIYGELSGKQGIDNSQHIIWYSPFGTFTGYYDKRDYEVVG
jgi:hypothetical protein